MTEFLHAINSLSWQGLIALGVILYFILVICGKR